MNQLNFLHRHFINNNILIIPCKDDNVFRPNHAPFLPGPENTKIKDRAFTKRFFIYHPSNMSMSRTQSPTACLGISSIGTTSLTSTMPFLQDRTLFTAPSIVNLFIFNFIFLCHKMLGSKQSPVHMGGGFKIENLDAFSLTVVALILGLLRWIERTVCKFFS